MPVGTSGCTHLFECSGGNCLHFFACNSPTHSALARTNIIAHNRRCDTVPVPMFYKTYMHKSKHSNHSLLPLPLPLIPMSPATAQHPPRSPLRLSQTRPSPCHYSKPPFCHDLDYPSPQPLPLPCPSTPSAAVPYPCRCLTLWPLHPCHHPMHLQDGIHRIALQSSLAFHASW